MNLKLLSQKRLKRKKLVKRARVGAVAVAKKKKRGIENDLPSVAEAPSASIVKSRSLSILVKDSLMMQE